MQVFLRSYKKTSKTFLYRIYIFNVLYYIKSLKSYFVQKLTSAKKFWYRILFFFRMTYANNFNACNRYNKCFFPRYEINSDYQKFSTVLIHNTINHKKTVFIHNRGVFFIINETMSIQNRKVIRLSVAYTG